MPRSPIAPEISIVVNLRPNCLRQSPISVGSSAFCVSRHPPATTRSCSRERQPWAYVGRKPLIYPTPLFEGFGRIDSTQTTHGRLARWRSACTCTAALPFGDRSHPRVHPNLLVSFQSISNCPARLAAGAESDAEFPLEYASMPLEHGAQCVAAAAGLTVGPRRQQHNTSSFRWIGLGSSAPSYLTPGRELAHAQRPPRRPPRRPRAVPKYSTPVRACGVTCSSS